ncbi:hypothetical protein EV421DRAFT_553603 [Armillaria borealis]|uniref:Uncharacterized protein n=1 Tax=Armillaria borealis TaxID=47425 RepID=A0AA39JJH9_9AGAR|nr:hypothetical protein EV421DRAFT_553603 [Armillaria borealis]
MFLIGLVIFLRLLQEALSWIICAATAVVYAAYVAAIVLPILFPTVRHSVISSISLRHITPQISWKKYSFLDAWRQRRFSDMIHRLPNVKTRDTKTLTMVESECVQQTATNLAAEALNWLLSVSSNPSVQSIVIQSIGGLPMASNKLLLNLGPNIIPIIDMHKSLLKRCLQVDGELLDCDQPIPGMELKVERLLRLFPYHSHYIVAPDVDSLELNAAIQSVEVAGLPAEGRPAGLLDPAAFFRDIIQPSRALKLPPLCWSQLVRVARDEGAFRPLDPDDDDHGNMFPLHLCSSVLCSFDASQKDLKQDFGCPLVLTFSEALLYFPGKIYHHVLDMLSKFVRDPPSDWPSLPSSLRMFVVAVEFLLHRLALPESDSSHGIIHLSLTAAVEWIYDRTFAPREAAAVVKMLEDILTTEIILECSEELRQNKLAYGTIRAYRRCIIVSPSACPSVRGL